MKSIESCPSATELGALMDGRVEGPAREALEAHVADCPHCLAEAGLMRALLHDEPKGMQAWKVNRIAARLRACVPAVCGLRPKVEPALRTGSRRSSAAKRWTAPRAASSA